MWRREGIVAESLNNHHAYKGKTVKVPYLESVKETVKDTLGRLQSICPCVGAGQLKQLTKRTTFVRVTEQENPVFEGIMFIQSLDMKQLWTRVAAVREQTPLVHNITNFVVMNNTANALLALGASPAMVHSLDEVEDFVVMSQALVVNIGTLDSQQIAACKLAVMRAGTVGVPWILDPVGAGATPYRQAAAIALARLRPTVIRGNGSEILTLAQQSGQSRGVDSVHGSSMALGAAQLLAVETGAVVAVTGTVDYVTDGAQVVAIENGHPLMTRVTGLGCSATAVIGAFLAVETDAVMATVAALAAFGVAGEIAGETARWPGSLQVAFLDTLYQLDEATLCSRARVKVFEQVEEAGKSG